MHIAILLSIFYNSSQKQPDILSVDKIIEPGQVFTGELSFLILNLEVLQTEAINKHQKYILENTHTPTGDTHRDNPLLFIGGFCPEWSHLRANWKFLYFK